MGGGGRFDSIEGSGFKIDSSLALRKSLYMLDAGSIPAASTTCCLRAW